MQNKAKISFLLLTLAAIVLYACSKYKDPPPAKPPDGLTNHYCNDPLAVNYNWGFPGIPDSTICYYPRDSFMGNWIFNDTVYLPDGTISTTQTIPLTFGATEDTVKTHLTVKGWCPDPTIPFYITANKFSRADADTLIEGSWGQFLCSSSDTMNGFFLKNPGNTMRVELTITNAVGTTYHKGTAVKQ